MELNKITLMEAYLIETLRRNGITDHELLNQVELRDVSPWEEINQNFDFNILVQLADQDKEIFKSIILKGYNVKFVTYSGLQNLIYLKFDKIKERDYQLIDKGITGLRLKEDDFDKLKQILSKNWVILEKKIEDSDMLSIKITMI